MRFEDVLPALREGKTIKPFCGVKISKEDVCVVKLSEILNLDWEIVEEKPLPCPFCGETKLLYTASTNGRVAMVQCSNTKCHALGPQADNMENAIRLWDCAKR